MWGISLLRPYLEGSRLTVLTDQKSLRWTLTMSEGTDKLLRWLLRLLEFEFVVVNHAGVKHQAPVAL